MSKERGRHQAAELIPGRIRDIYAWRKHAPRVPFLSVVADGGVTTRIDWAASFSLFFSFQTAPRSPHRLCCATRTALAEQIVRLLDQVVCLLTRQARPYSGGTVHRAPPSSIHQLEPGPPERQSALIVRPPSHRTSGSSAKLQYRDGTDECGDRQQHRQLKSAARGRHALFGIATSSLRANLLARFSPTGPS